MSLHDFRYRITTEELGEELANYIRGTSLESLFDNRRLQRLVKKFWMEKYPSVHSEAFYSATIKFKMKEAEDHAFEKLQEDKKRFFKSLVRKLLQWAKEKDLPKVTRADVGWFLMDEGIKIDHSSQSILYREGKAEYQIANKFGADEKQYFKSLIEKIIEWAQSRNLMRITRADVKLFLMENGIKLSTASEGMLYREAKLKYRYLPPWMRK